MNERIKQLAEQVDREFDNPGARHKAIERFAELIVRECADIGNKAWKEDGEYTYIGDKIKEHFGVDDKSIKVGSRIKVVSKFNVGARGTVNYIEPTGKLWVRRDGASSDVSYYPTEVIGDD
jgi:hypothetical protein